MQRCRQTLKAPAELMATFEDLFHFVWQVYEGEGEQFNLLYKVEEGTPRLAEMERVVAEQYYTDVLGPKRVFTKKISAVVDAVGHWCGSAAGQRTDLFSHTEGEGGDDGAADAQRRGLGLMVTFSPLLCQINCDRGALGRLTEVAERGRNQLLDPDLVPAAQAKRGDKELAKALLRAMLAYYCGLRECWKEGATDGNSEAANRMFPFPTRASAEPAGSGDASPLPAGCGEASASAEPADGGGAASLTPSALTARPRAARSQRRAAQGAPSGSPDGPGRARSARGTQSPRDTADQQRRLSVAAGGVGTESSVQAPVHTLVVNSVIGCLHRTGCLDEVEVVLEGSLITVQQLKHAGGQSPISSSATGSAAPPTGGAVAGTWLDEAGHGAPPGAVGGSSMLDSPLAESTGRLPMASLAVGEGGPPPPGIGAGHLIAMAPDASGNMFGIPLAGGPPVQSPLHPLGPLDLSELFGNSGVGAGGGGAFAGWSASPASASVFFDMEQTQNNLSSLENT